MKSKGQSSDHGWYFPAYARLVSAQSCTRVHCNGTKATGNCIHSLKVIKWACPGISFSKLNHCSTWYQTPAAWLTSPSYKLKLFKLKSDSAVIFPSPREKHYWPWQEQGCWIMGLLMRARHMFTHHMASGAQGCVSPLAVLGWISLKQVFVQPWAHCQWIIYF